MSFAKNLWLDPPYIELCWGPRVDGGDPNDCPKTTIMPQSQNRLAKKVLAGDLC